MQNPYDSLKTPYLDDAPDLSTLAPVFRVTVSSYPAETISINTAPMDGWWVYGYTVYWACGQVSNRQADPSLGLFRTENDARLHCIGFMKMYRSHFKPDTYDNLCAAEAKYLKPTLPLL